MGRDDLQTTAEKIKAEEQEREDDKKKKERPGRTGFTVQ
jgi:hypothetical protein